MGLADRLGGGVCDAIASARVTVTGSGISYRCCGIRHRRRLNTPVQRGDSLRTVEDAREGGFTGHCQGTWFQPDPGQLLV